MTEYNLSLIEQMARDRYESLPEDIKVKIDLFRKSDYQLKEIKRKRPKLEKGDVFALKVTENLYFYGAVINCGINDEAYGDNLAVVCIFSIAGQSIDKDAVIGFDAKKIIVGPKIISRSYWTNGIFFNTGEKIEIPEDFSYGFHRAYGLRKEKSLFVDEYRNELKERPEFFNGHGLTTEIGIAYYLHYELIVDDSFLSKECQKIYREYLNYMFTAHENEPEPEMIGPFMIMEPEDDDEYTILFNSFLAYEEYFYKFSEELTGSGYDWEDVFRTYIKNNYADKADLFDYDSEADLMCIYCKDREVAIELVTEIDKAIQERRFSSLIEQTEFSDLI